MSGHSHPSFIPRRTFRLYPGQRHRPPLVAPAYIGNRRARDVRAMLNGECANVFDDDISVRDAVVDEFKPLILRVRYPSNALYRAFLTELTSYGVEESGYEGGHGRLNITATGYRRAVAWLKRRATDARSLTLRAIESERRDALANESYRQHPIWDPTVTRGAREAVARLWGHLLSDHYVDLERFAVTNAGYRALQLATQDVWHALDNQQSANTAFKASTCRTAAIDVPSPTRWDVVTSLVLPFSGPHVRP